MTEPILHTILAELRALRREMAELRAPAAQPERSTEVSLFAAAQARSMVVSGDGRVGEADAAAILEISHGRLRNLRDEGRGPPPYRRGVGGSRISYRLADLAQWVEDSREYY